MRRVLMFLVCTAILLSGCKSTSSAQMTLYENDYKEILSQDTFSEESSCFTLSGEMTKDDEGKYPYYIIVDEARTAMYSVVVMAVENDTPYEDADKMMPSIGIFDGPYTMIPDQVNSEDNYVKGMVVSGETDEAEADLKIMVEWTDESGENISREFFHVVLNEDGMRYA